MNKILVFVIMAFILSACTSPTLTSPDPDLRREAVDLKAGEEGASMASRFMELLDKDPDNLVRAQCAHYLGRFKCKEALPLLLKLAEDKDVIIRQDVVWALGEIGAPDSIEALKLYLERLEAIEPTDKMIHYKWLESVEITKKAIEKVKNKNQTEEKGAF